MLLNRSGRQTERMDSTNEQLSFRPFRKKVKALTFMHGE
jgi:hypothetical protein